jgi:Type ISP C-terminal specificity domain/N-6 DNA Methylase
MVATPVDVYRRQIEKELQAGNATEQTHRPALKTLLEALAPKITATNEPKRVECGAPDFSITEKRAHGSVTVGHVEAKDVGKDLDEVEKSDQMRRYLPALSNLVLTDYLEFRWYIGGEHRQSARLAHLGKGGRLAPENDGTMLVSDLLAGFLSEKAEPISDPKALALRMARLTQFIRDMIVAAFEGGRASATLRDLHEAFEKALIPDLPIPQFADMFAQTLAYGLFAARVNHRGPRGSFKRLGAAAEIPKTNPFLRKLFETITGTELDEEPYAGFVDDLAQLLADTDMEAVLADFGKRTVRQDPVVHFYETFLAAYDPKLREVRGVYYTPEPVVSYIVRSVDYLLKTRFGCADGLADATAVEYEREEEGNRGKPEKVRATSPRVLILDPACGTGTFLYTVIDHIRGEFVRQGNVGMWSGYVRAHLLPRIFGFELLMAPYAVAHFKLGMQLGGHDMTPAQREKWAYDFSGDERLGVYLTNTLEEAERRAETLFGPLRVIAQEANAASEIKHDLPILAVIGNPPYAGHSANRSWEMKADPKTKKLKRLPNFIGQLIQDYHKADGQPLGERTPKWLQDDYVKFIRWGQWRIERTGAGILAFITNHGYLDNPTFRGMRQSLMSLFTDIYVLNLHGNSKKKERCPDGSPDQNVFDIQQGVTLGIFVKEAGKASPTRVLHADLWGLREKKYDYLIEMDVERTSWEQLSPKSPEYLFVPQDSGLAAEYEQGWSITRTFRLYGAGMTTARDHVVIDFERKPLLGRATLFRDSKDSDADLCAKLGIPEKKGWNIKNARKLIQGAKDLSKHVRPVLYRPFDGRLIFYHDALVWRTVKRVMGQMIGRQNVGLLATRQTRDKWDVFATRLPVTHKSLSAYDITSLFPLYLSQHPNGHKQGQGELPAAVAGRANLESAFVAELETRLGLTFSANHRGDLRKAFGPEDVFNYIYAIFHSPAYRMRYVGFLKSGFPRVPLTSDVSQFRSLCGLGSELVALHLLESPKLEKPITRYPVKGPDLVDKGFPKYVAPSEPEPGGGKPVKEGRVYINKGEPERKIAGQHFEGVAPQVWNFHIGGYQVCEKWLKDRRGRTLTYDDQLHYCKIVAALSETIRLMAEIDAAIPKWPIE